MQGAEMRLARHGARRHDVFFGGAAVAMAAAVFAIDTLTSIEGAIAVLYVISLLLAAEAIDRTGLKILTVIFIGLSLLSFLFTHGPEPDLQTFLRLSVAVAALCVTTALLLRTDRARTELLGMNTALRESEARYRSIFDRARVALWERDYSKLRDFLAGLKHAGVSDVTAHSQTDPEFVSTCMNLIKVVAANEAAIELLGTSTPPDEGGVTHQYIPADSKAFLSILQAIMDGAAYFEDNAEIINRNGERKAVLLSISFPDDPSAFNRVVVSMVDVTQREEARKALTEAQAELARASKAATIGVLSASLAHDLNQPLGAIGVNCQTLVRWLDRDPPDIEAAKRSAERILRDSGRASDIFKSTRLSMSAASKDKEKFDLGELIGDTLALMEHDLQRERTTVKVVQNDRIQLVGVKLELQQVLINLITNAAQAIAHSNPALRLVTISVDGPIEADYISIAIRDTGDGLVGETQRKLFTPFFTTKENGMGIGLAICRSSIEARGGSLEGSNHPDGGAVFEIKLPKEPVNA
ncbi:ATP-binding protein [Rhizobium sp. Rhizsp42]|uniref:PAS domain-containing sensor histidine kinase n=1 Tax=Rhizobium sp. Rhizsp42 TaxID=3243034 RepID=UPI0039AED4AB